MTDCERCRSWIWESADNEPAPAEIERHLDSCAACRDEARARRAVSRDLFRLGREEGSEAPPSALDRRVLSAAHATAGLPQPRGWSRGAPAALPWALVAALALALAGLTGYELGRVDPIPPAQLPPAATQPVRGHSVSLSSTALRALSDSGTFLLAGPEGGPYEVVGTMRWDGVAPDLAASTSGERHRELLVAVGPEDSMDEGHQIGLVELYQQGHSILGRRALSFATPLPPTPAEPTLH